MAIDPQTGQQKWTFDQFDVTDSGILTTATDLLFTGGREGYFYALDARTGDAAVEGEPRRPDRERPDHLRHRRQTVRVGDLGQLAGHVRAAELTRRMAEGIRYSSEGATQVRRYTTMSCVASEELRPRS